MTNTCWVITGPTASGKTALSLRLAQAHNCEIVCMDSMQIYRGMDIGTAKPTPEEQSQAVHHMLDVADPDESFSVMRYQHMAEDVIREIQARGKRALLVGGTGLYLRALRHPMVMGTIGGNEEIRQRLEAIASTEAGKQQLHDQLEQVDPETAARLHLNDVRRIVRALEVYELTGLPFSKQPAVEEPAAFPYRVVTLDMDRALLYQRVEQRVDAMMEQGLVDEVRRLREAGIPDDAQAMKGLGYKELLPYLRGEYSLEKAIYEIKLGTRHYAKRQLTWMRREEDVLWVNRQDADVYEQIENYFLQGEQQ